MLLKTAFFVVAVIVLVSLPGCNSEEITTAEEGRPVVIDEAALEESGIHLRKEDESPVTDPVIFKDDFNSGSLNLTGWEPTSANDFNKKEIDVIDVTAEGDPDYRLRLMANTIGTADDTVKYLGVRYRNQLDFTREKTIEFDLDWNDQANGCYMTAGLFLCPVETGTDPSHEPDWIAFEYIGVPPGENARFQISKKVNGNFQYVFTEGWPDEQRVGREIDNQHLEITVDTGMLLVKENGTVLYDSYESGLHFDSAYLYLQMSSHSNYPDREMYFDNLVIIE
ncbi:MAG: hypothetical protein JW712_12975 [Dehalococcoidales bacterium]|nr:hypothetical protein [Dehalococcoidales bacterium]